jgi:hypothetical protein
MSRMERTASLQCGQGSPGQTGGSAPRSRLREKSLLLVARAQSLSLCVRKRLHALSAELCSLAYRIQILWKNRLAEFGIDSGPLYETTADGHLVQCMRTRACTQGIADLQKRYPWLSLADLYLCQKAWAAGFETCARHSIGFGNRCRNDLP